MKTSFSIIIVTWNGLHHLKNFLPSVVKTDYTEFEIIIADNCSNDGTAEWIRNHYPGCRIVTFDQNYGYCGGNNRAVPYATGDVLIFLNNDVRVQADWLTPLGRSFESGGADIVQPKILSHKNPAKFEYAGAAGGMIDRLGYPFCRGRLFEHLEEDHGQYDDESELFWASGAAMVIRKEVFIKLGGFDEEFEFHMEEIDLCWRAWNRGYKTKFQPESVVYHLGGGSLPMESPRKVYYNYRNSLMMLTKNLSSGLFAKIFLRLCLDGVAGMRSLLSLKPGETAAIIKSHFGYYRRLPSVLKKRKLLEDSGGLLPDKKPPIYNGLIIFDYFLKGSKKFTDIDFEEE